ncbi:alpha/beta fold hydrolase [Candidimonas nitroreducens]|nr:alpha/beta fold hydrolase [Candidimonas nitroreducens]
MGSFHVGGEPKSLQGKPLMQATLAVGGVPVTMDPNGDYVIGQMYAQYFLGGDGRRPPILFWHGGGLTGACWETTPDDRRGWVEDFLLDGWDIYLCDAVERGRSGYAPIPDVWPAPISQTAASLFVRFRIGHAETNTTLENLAGHAFPGSQFPARQFTQFMRQVVPRWSHTDEQIMAAYHALLRRIGRRSIIVCHSQGGMFGLRSAMEAPDAVTAVVALEPASVPLEKARQLGYSTPTLIVLGDYIDTDTRWPRIRDRIMQFAAEFPCVQVLSLPEIGIKGNSHMLMMDKNNMEISGKVRDWLYGMAGADSARP